MSLDFLEILGRRKKIKYHKVGSGQIWPPHLWQWEVGQETYLPLKGCAQHPITVLPVEYGSRNNCSHMTPNRCNWLPYNYMLYFFTFQTVLTATVNSYGDRQISTPTKSISLNQSIKNSAQLITSTRGPPIPNLVQNTHTGGFWANGWNTTKIFFYLFILFFSD